MPTNPGVIFTPNSSNKKLRGCAITYTSQATCPESCGLRNNGCYAETGVMALGVTFKVNQTPKPALEISRREARMIVAQAGLLPRGSGIPLRLHGVGDCKTPRAAELLAEATKQWRRLGHGPVWTYTHSWAKIPRASWGRISVLASCEFPAGVKLAQAKGYATAMVVPWFESKKLYRRDGLNILPCPEQTGMTSGGCGTCRLCWDDTRLRREKITIGFRAHGQGGRGLAERLVEIQGYQPRLEGLERRGGDSNAK